MLHSAWQWQTSTIILTIKLFGITYPSDYQQGENMYQLWEGSINAILDAWFGPGQMSL